MKQYDPIFEAAGKEWNVDPNILRAIAQQESGGNPRAVSPKGARGVMQIMPATGRELGVTNFDDPEQSIYAGAKYFSQMLDQFKKPELALAAYNAGPDNVAKGRFPDETLRYVPAVTGHYKKFAASGQTANDASGVAEMDPAVKAAAAGVLNSAQGKPDVAGFLKSTGGVDVDGFLKATGGAPAGGGSAPPKVDVDAFLKETGAAPPKAEPAPPPKTDMRNVDPMTMQPYTAGAPPKPPLAPIPGAAPDSASTPSPSRVGQPAPVQQGVLSRVGEAIASPFVEGGGLGPDTSTGAFFNGPMGLVNRLVVAQPLAALDAAGRGIQGAFRGIGALGGAAIEGLGFQGAGARFQRDVGQAPDALAAMVPTSAPRGAPRAVGNKLAPYERIADDLQTRSALTAKVEGVIDQAAPGLTPDARASAVTRVVDEMTAPKPPASEPAGPRSVGAAAFDGVEPMSQGEMRSQRATAERDKLAEPQPAGMDNNDYVPGVNPTEAQIMQNARVSRREKQTAMEMPEGFSDLAKANNEARLDFLKEQAGTDTLAYRLREDRGAQADADLQAAWRNKQPANAQPVVDQAAAILDSPDGVRPLVRNAVNETLDLLKDKNGNLHTDPEMLYGARKAIDDILSPEAQREKPVSKRIATQLGNLKATLDGVIEEAAPGFRQYLKNFSEASRPIDEMEVLQGYLVPGKAIDTQSRVTYSGVQRMLRDLVTARDSRGTHPAQSISDETMAKLFALRDDLRRVATADELAKAKGSDTVQNAVDFVKNAASKGIVAGLHVGANAFAPGIGSVGVQMVTNKLRQGAIARDAERALNPPRNKLSP